MTTNIISIKKIRKRRIKIMGQASVINGLQLAEKVRSDEITR